MLGSTSARKTIDGLDVQCACGERFALPKDGGEHACPCGWVHRYDGKQLLSTPGHAGRPGPEIGNPNPAPSGRDPRASHPPRRETRPL